MAENWHCYCDECCIGRPHRYMAVGGVLLRASERGPLTLEIEKWRALRRMNRELKWQKIGDAKFAAYHEFVTARLEDISSGRMSFSAIIIDRHRLDHHGYNDGSEDEGFSKFFYQLILHRFIPILGRGDRLSVFPDKKNESYDYGRLQSSLNGGIVLKYRHRRNVISKVQPICSETTNCGQANDILLGAVGFHANDKHLDPNTRPPKIAMAEYIADSLGVPDLATPTPAHRMDFGIWRFILGERIKNGARNPSRKATPQ